MTPTDLAIIEAAEPHLRGVYGRDTDCVRLVADVLGAVYGRVPRPQILIAPRPVEPWGGIEGVVAAGLGVEVRLPEAGAWHYCQRWRGLDGGRFVPGVSRGHAWLWCGGPEGVCIEATNAPRRWRRWARWPDMAGRGEVRLVRLREVTGG